METKFKKGDIVYWQDLQGEITDIDFHPHYPIEATFNNGRVLSFTIDGRNITDTPPVLSHTPYTLNGFTQNSVIEKDTIVWVRYSDNELWEQRFYSHFKDGKHYCFEGQETSNETKEIFSWNYLETENPLLKKLTSKNK